jgi:3-hydroxyisobutyrate dehydrogenase-like beta-hydroxyacid dehydrogenase
MLKDINLALESATSAGATLPLGSSTAAIYKDISAGGDGKKDFAYVYQHCKKQNKNQN